MASKEENMAAAGVDELTWQQVWDFLGFEPTGDSTRDLGPMLGALAAKVVEQNNEIAKLWRCVARLGALLEPPQ